MDLRLGRQDDGRSRGFCHVAYASVESMERALQLSESSFFGRDLHSSTPQLNLSRVCHKKTPYTS